jgi:hypothetical protein
MRWWGERGGRDRERKREGEGDGVREREILLTSPAQASALPQDPLMP